MAGSGRGDGIRRLGGITRSTGDMRIGGTSGETEDPGLGRTSKGTGEFILGGTNRVRRNCEISSSKSIKKLPKAKHKFFTVA